MVVNILFVARDAHVGGGTTFRYRLSKGLIQCGHQIWLASQGGEMASRFKELGVRCIRIPPTPFNRPLLIWLLKRLPIDVIHASNATSGDDVTWCRRFIRLPFVVSVHGLIPLTAKNPCFAQSGRIVTFDEANIECLRQIETVKEDKLRLVRRPVEVRPLPPVSKAGFTALYLGRLSKSKGKVALALLDALPELKKSIPNLRARIVGGGTMLKAVQKKAHEVNRSLGEDIAAVHGATTDPLPFVAESDVVVGAGYAALEPLMHGKAVIGAGYDGFGPVTADNLRDAVAFNFGDCFPKRWQISAASFEQALREIHEALNDPARRNFYANLNRFIEHEHRIETVAQQMEQIYLEAMDMDAT